MEDVKYGLSSRDSAEKRLTRESLLVLVPLNMTYVMPLLSKPQKTRSNLNRTRERKKEGFRIEPARHQRPACFYRRKRDTERSRLPSQTRRDTRHHGTKRLRKEHPRLHHNGTPQVQSHERRYQLRRTNTTQPGTRRKGQKRGLSRIPIPLRSPRSFALNVPPNRLQLGSTGRQEGRLGSRDGLGSRVPEALEGETQASRHGRFLRNAIPERGILGRREEAV